MADEVSSKVVGGYQNPRFLLVGPELSPNVGFEENTDGWGSSLATIAREFDDSSPFGDYVLTAEDDDAGTSEYAECTIPAGEAVADLRFIVTFWARNDAADGDLFFFTQFTQQEGGAIVKNYTVDQKWQMFTQEVTVDDVVAGNNVLFHINMGAAIEGAAAQGKLRIEHFRCRKIIESYELPMPDRGKLRETFKEVLQASNELSNKTQLEYVAGHRYFYQAEYDYMTAAQEVLRRRSRSRDHEVLFFPHKDAAQNYIVRWDEDLEIGWAFGIASAGHAGNVALKAVEVIPYLPIEIIDATNEYSAPDDLYVMGGGLFYE